MSNMELETRVRQIIQEELSSYLTSTQIISLLEARLPADDFIRGIAVQEILRYHSDVIPEPEPTPEPAPVPLTNSDAITVAHDGQIVEGLKITSNSDGINVNGFRDVTLRNLQVLHKGGHGIRFNDAPGITIDTVEVIHTGAPSHGQNSVERNNIFGTNSSDATISNVRLIRGSTGIYLIRSDRAIASWIEGHDFRGPFPRGQLWQPNRSHDCILQDFSCENPRDTSWPEDVINCWRSNNPTVRRGLIDGCNENNGWGVLIEQSNGEGSGGLVEEVTCTRMGNGAFAGYPAKNVTFRRCHTRDNICTDQGRGAPTSNALSYGGEPRESSGLRIEGCQYWNLCNDNLIWSRSVFDVVELTEQDFSLRPPIRLHFPWDQAGRF